MTTGDPTLFLINIAIILVFTKIGGMISKRLGCPSVLGQVLTGIILGPSLLGLIRPDAFLDQIGQIGVILLMFLAGLDTDMKQMKTLGVFSLFIAIGGVVLPLAAGFGFTFVFRQNIQEALLVGIILTATSVSITAQTLLEMGKLKTPEGNAILGAAVIDDILGVVLLATMVGMGPNFNIWMLLGKIGLFFAVVFGFGIFVLPRLVNTYSKFDIREGRITLALGSCLLFAWLAEYLGVAAIIGAYLIGIFFGQTKIRRVIVERMEVVAYTIFVPVFFVNIGAVADLNQLRSDSFLFLAGLILIAILSKIFGCMGGALLGKFSLKSSLIIGIGMIARGEVGLIVASLGLRKGLIGQDIFAGAVLLVLVSTLITPMLLSLAFKASPTLEQRALVGQQQLGE